MHENQSGPLAPCCGLSDCCWRRNWRRCWRRPMPLRLSAVRDDGSPLAFEDTPMAATLEKGGDQNEVVLGLRHGDGARAWISVTTRAIVEPAK